MKIKVDQLIVKFSLPHKILIKTVIMIIILINN